MAYRSADKKKDGKFLEMLQQLAEQFAQYLEKIHNTFSISESEKSIWRLEKVRLYKMGK